MKRFLIVGALLLLVGSLAYLYPQAQNFGGTGLPSGLTYASPVFTISSAGNGNGQLALSGTTSGSATFTAPSVAGTATNAVLASNSLQLASGDVYNWNNDTGLSRASATLVDVGNGTAGNTGGFVKSAQTLQVITNNYTTSATTLAAAGVVTGLNFTVPASSASNWSFRCDLVYSQATAAAADLFGITTAQTAPTSLLGFGEVYTSLAGANVDGSAVITTATSTTLVTATPGAFGAIGTTADMFAAHIYGTVEAPSNASATQVGISVASGNASDALTIYRGSACWWY